MLESINRFLKSLDFLKGIVMAVAMLIPVFLSQYFFDDIHFGFSIALGVLFCSPTDVPGSNKHVFFGIFIASFLSFGLTLLFGSVANIFWLLLPLLGVFVFLVSYISVFGFRASLISFVGLLAIVLSFIHDYSEESLLLHASLIALGGLWYLSLTYLKLQLFPKMQVDQLFSKTIEKTVEYLRIRAELFVNSNDRSALQHKLFELQIEINELHETLREIILASRSNSVTSNRTRRQQLIFTELIDILELAIANPVDYEKFDSVFKKHKEKTEAFQQLVFEIANHLEHISKVIRKEEKLKENTKIPEILKNIDRHIDYYRILVGLPKARKGTLMLLNLKNYQEKQVQNVIAIERVLNNYRKNDEILSDKEANRFITPQDYDFKKLTENFSFNSPIFKHSLRLAIVVLVGFAIGKSLSMQNPYWILLTIIIIMRPSFGMTKSRSIHRVVGTLIGAAIASIVILITQNTNVYAVIAVISLPLAFSLVQLNFRNAAVFVTINVIFVYALFEPNILSVIQFRILDTLIGASLAFASNYVLWPTWQFQNIQEDFIKAIASNQHFLKQVAIFYREKGAVSTAYKLSRKAAFLAIGDLNAAFQRMSQDPKSKQVELSTIYEIVVFNNTFLSSLTALGTFIKNNKTSDVPSEFNIYVENICSNLELASQILEKTENVKTKSPTNVEDAENLYDTFFENLSKKRDHEIAMGEEHSQATGAKLKETLLVSEQLKWLYKLSEKLIASAKKYSETV
ncbi:MAG: FUSC family membrane protein [Lutibacter sp.]|nr:FUSC family membrane protein [Lutibacter sp.]